MNNNDEAYKFFAEYVYKHTGISYKEADYYRLDSRFNALISHFKLTDVTELLSFYKKEISKDMHTLLIDLCTNNETYFMRDLKPFKSLGKDVMKYLDEELKVKGDIVIWSAACSTGQEPYSILMAIENFGDPRLLKKIKLHASDISEEALNKAKSGLYSDLEVQRGLPANMLIKYFTKFDKSWKINPDIHNKVEFSSLNLLTGSLPKQKYYVVFCRNVLIYQEMDNKRDILSKVCDSLKSGGLLFLGAGESLIGMKLPFRQIQMGDTFCYQKF